MHATKPDPLLYFSFLNDHLSGINASYVDDLLRAGTPDFKEQSQITHRRFETSGDEELPLTSFGFHMALNNVDALSVDQE